MDHDTRPAIVPVSFEFGEARAGWITMTVRAGEMIDRVACSDVFDPFQELVTWATQIGEGMLACVDIDEEGINTQMWLIREPGCHVARLKVFDPGMHGQPDPLNIDAVVDAVQVAHAFHEAFARLVATYDPKHWDIDYSETKPARDILGAIELRRLRAAVASYGVLPGEAAYAEGRAAYEAELGDLAMPDLSAAKAPADA